MSISPRHAQIRENRLGSSDTAALFGISPWQTAYDVWLRLTGRLTPSNEENAVTLMGKEMEAPLLDWAAKEEGLIIVKNQLRVHPTLPMSAQHDALIKRFVSNSVFQHGVTVDTQVNDTTITKGMEAKATIKSDAWGKPGTDQVPDLYNIQAHHQMIVSNLDEIIMPVGILTYGLKRYIYRVPLNPDLRDLIIEKILAFMKLVESDTPPEMSFPSPEVAARVIRKVNKRVQLPVQASVWADKYQRIGKAITKLEKAKAEVKAMLQGAMVDADEGAFKSVTGEAMLFKAIRTKASEYTVKKEAGVMFKVVKDKQEGGDEG